MVPTRVKGGVSGAGACAATVDVGAGAAGDAGVGGRRDTENSGRSRVAESFEAGMAHKGLPAGEGSAIGDPPSGGTASLASGTTVSVPIAARETSRNWGSP